jgi:hypothetical protein
VVIILAQVRRRGSRAVERLITLARLSCDLLV